MLDNPSEEAIPGSNDIQVATWNNKTSKCWS